MLILLASGAAQAAQPRLERIDLPGGQRGTEQTFTFHGERLKNVQEVLFYRPGISANAIEKTEDSQAVIRLQIAEDCPLGEHMVRLRTASGITELRTLWVGALPTVAEEEPNSDFASPQPIELNVTVAGVVKNEDVDYFLIQAQKGQRITAEIEAMRLGQSMFDPYVAILDMGRFERSASDDSPLLLQDSVASIVAEEDGPYVVMVREASYGGSNTSRYRLHVGTFPRPRVAYPAGGRPEQTLKVELRGDASGPMSQTITLPTESDTNRFSLFAMQEGQTSPSPIAMRVVDRPTQTEVEPNNKRAEATVLTDDLPAAFDGVIETAGDVDFFRFRAQKGRAYHIDVFARRLRSPLDAVINLSKGEGGNLSNNDDGIGLDPYLRFDAPEDGEYVLRIRDQLGNGGETFVYRIEIAPVQPRLSLTLPQFDRQRPQNRQTVAVPQGNRNAALIRAARVDFGGPVIVEPVDMPDGMTFTCDTMADGVDVLPVVFEAAADAPIAGRLTAVSARHADADRAIGGELHHDIPLVIGQPNRTVYYSTQVDRLAVAVTQPVPFRITIIEPKAPIAQNGSMALRVVAERDEEFDGPIDLSMLWNPPGLSSASSVRIEKGQTEAVYPINSNGNASTRTWKIAIVGHADTGYGHAWVSTQLATIEVVEPFVTGSVEMAVAEQGQPAAVLCKLEPRRPFEGQATLSLHGLPPHATTEATPITPDATEHAFTVSTTAETPTGQHKALFCEVIVMVNGEPVAHRFGSGVLRVDKPRVSAPEDSEQPQEKPKDKEPAKPKPLSRLEQLRLEREQQLEKANP